LFEGYGKTGRGLWRKLIFRECFVRHGGRFLRAVFKRQKAAAAGADAAAEHGLKKWKTAGAGEKREQGKTAQKKRIQRA